MNLGNTDTAVAYTPGYTPPVAAPAAPPSAPGASPAAPSAPPTAVSSYAAGSGALVAPQSGMSGILFGPPDGSSGAPGVPTVGTWNRALWGKPYTPNADWTKPASAYGALMDSGGTVTVDPFAIPSNDFYAGTTNYDFYAPQNVQASEPVSVVGQDTGTTYAQTGADQQETLTFTPASGGSAQGGEAPTVGTRNTELYGKQFDSSAAWQNHQVDPSLQAPTGGPGDGPYWYAPTNSEVTNSLSSILAANPQMKAEDAYKLTQTMQAGQAAIQRGTATPQQVQDVLTRISGGLTPHVPDMTNYRPVVTPPADPTVWTKAPPLLPDEQGNINPGDAGRARITPPNTGDAGLVSGSGRGMAVHATADPKFEGTGRTLSQIRGTEYWSDEERAWYLMMIGQPLAPAGGAPAGPATGPDGRTVAQIRGTDYFSPEERTWYLQQIGQAPTPSAPAAPAAPTTGVTPPARSTGDFSAWNESQTVHPQYGLWGSLGVHPYTGQTQFPPNIEQWRPLVQQYIAPQDVNKVLHMITYESSGNPNATNGYADGLVQIERSAHGNKITQQQARDPNLNLAYAAHLIYGAPWPPR